MRVNFNVKDTAAVPSLFVKKKGIILTLIAFVCLLLFLIAYLHQAKIIIN